MTFGETPMKPVIFLFLLMGANVSAQTSSNTTITARSQQSTAIAQMDAQATAIQASDQIARQVWGLTADELERAKLLLKGPRASFSVPNLSPVEALGIHARSDAERRKYAEMFAKAMHEDTERVLAWAMAYQIAIQRLYPNEKVIDFSGLQAADMSTGTTDAANLPRHGTRPIRRGGGGAQ